MTGVTRERRRWARALIALIVAGAIADGAVTWHTHSQEEEERERSARIEQDVQILVKLARERDPNLTEQEALREIRTEIKSLREKSSALERELEGVKRYGSVAKLNGFGLSGKVQADSGLSETSAISRALEKAYIRREEGGRVTFLPRCDSTGIGAFRKAAEINPDFPFSYWALATCGAETGDEGWRSYAKRAVTILEHTTQIAGHHGHHDGALEQLRKRLAEQR